MSGQTCNADHIQLQNTRESQQFCAFCLAFVQSVAVSTRNSSTRDRRLARRPCSTLSWWSRRRGRRAPTSWQWRRSCNTWSRPSEPAECMFTFTAGNRYRWRLMSLAGRWEEKDVLEMGWLKLENVRRQILLMLKSTSEHLGNHSIPGPSRACTTGSRNHTVYPQRRPLLCLWLFHRDAQMHTSRFINRVTVWENKRHQTPSPMLVVGVWHF